MTQRLIHDNEDELILDPHFIWEDENTWSAHVQSMDYALDGTLIVENSIKKAGMPITLSLEENQGLADRALVDKLKAFQDKYPNDIFTLERFGKRYRVTWRAEEGEPAIEAHQAFFNYANPEDNDYVSLTVRFMEIPNNGH